MLITRRRLIQTAAPVLILSPRISLGASAPRLTFPRGTMPGFDPNHPASHNVQFSGIAGSGGGFINLLHGTPATIGGTPTSILDRHIGLSTSYTGNSDVNVFSFPTTAFPSITLASIFMLDTLGPTNSQVLIANNGTTNSLLLLLFNTAGVFDFGMIYGGVSLGFPFSASFHAAAAVPYFFAMSNNGNAGGSTYSILRRLDTGFLASNTQAGASGATVGDGSLYLGNKSNATGTRQLLGHQSHAMVSSYAMTLPELEQWAMNPWAFWYPQRTS